MHGTAVEGVAALAYTQETGTLLEGLVAQTLDLLQSLTVDKGAALVAVRHYLVGQCGTYAADVAEQLAAGGIQLYTNAVDAALNHIAKALGQHLLVHIVLILPHPDALWIDFNQLAEGVHQAAADADGTAHSDIVVGELATRHIAGTVHRGASLADTDGYHLIFEAATLHYLLGLAAGGTVADGNGLDMEGLDESLKLVDGGTLLAHRGEGINGLVVKQLSLGIETDHLAARAEAWVDGQGALLSQRCG